MTGRRLIKLVGLAPLAALTLAGAAMAQNASTTVDQHTQVTTTPSGGTIEEKSTTVAATPAYGTDAATATAQSKTVTHRDADGNVTITFEGVDDAEGNLNGLQITPQAKPAAK